MASPFLFPSSYPHLNQHLLHHSANLAIPFFRMSSPNAEAYGLPTHSPPFSEARPLGEPAKFAVFHTAPISSTARDELLTGLNSSSESSYNSKLAPTPDFSNKTLRVVYDHFVGLRNQDDTIQPFYFIVADRVNFVEDGVLVVCLDCSQGDGDSDDVGVARCGVNRADGWGAAIHCGLAGWDEVRADQALEWGDDDDVHHVDPELVDPTQRHADEAAKYGWNAGTYAIQDRNVYGWYSLVEKAVPINRMLDPLWLDKTPDECRFQMLGNYNASEDPWEDICREHPRQAAFRPRINRAIILVAEKEDADQDDGIAIVRLQSNRPPNVLARVSASVAITEADKMSQ